MKVRCSEAVYEPTGEKVVTHDGPDRGYRMCLCAKCGEVQRCTPENDFWTAKGVDGLLCDSCFDQLIIKRVYRLRDHPAAKGRDPDCRGGDDE